MKFDIETYLFTRGPMTSSALKKVLMDIGMSDEAARQRISRVGGEVMRFRYFPLPKRESFLYVAKDFNSRQFWNRLLSAHIEANTVYAHTFFAMRAYQGVIPAYLLAKVSGSPVRLSKHVPVSVLEEQMVKGELLRREHDRVLGECLVTHVHLHDGSHSTEQVRNQLLVEDIIIKGVSEWLKKNGLASFNKIESRCPEKMPVFSNHHWDITAPSYLQPLAIPYNGEINNGFVVADIVFGDISVDGINGFISKVKRCRNLRNIRPFLAILVADSFDKEAMRLAKNSGIMVTTVNNFLGSDIGSLMNSLLSTLNRAGAIAAANPEKINKLLNDLNRIEGAAINVRGAMFEMLVGHMVLKTQNVSTIDLNKKIHIEGKKAEIDVIAFRSEVEIKCYECKGYEVRRLIDREMIMRWIVQVQLMRRYFSSNEVYRNRKLTFEYWTSSDFSPEAIEELAEFKQRNNKITINWKNGSDILSIARDDNLTSIVNTLNDHYLKHPLSQDT